MSQIKRIADTLCRLAYFINENAEINKFTVMKDGRNNTVYEIDEWRITIKRDTDGSAYAIEIGLKRDTKLSDLQA